MSVEPALFKSISLRDHLHLFIDGRPNPAKIVDALHYGKKEVSEASNLPESSVRYDSKMPDVLQERLREWATAINLVAGYFGDHHKTVLWFATNNPLLGDVSPRDMIRVGRYKKLLKFIQTALDQNQR